MQWSVAFNYSDTFQPDVVNVTCEQQVTAELVLSLSHACSKRWHEMFYSANAPTCRMVHSMTFLECLMIKIWTRPCGAPPIQFRSLSLNNGRMDMQRYSRSTTQTCKTDDVCPFAKNDTHSQLWFESLQENGKDTQAHTTATALPAGTSPRLHKLHYQFRKSAVDFYVNDLSSSGDSYVKL